MNNRLARTLPNGVSPVFRLFLLLKPREITPPFGRETFKKLRLDELTIRAHGAAMAGRVDSIYIYRQSL
jgi:hypothetical protein